MQMQVEAERKKRAAILESEGMLCFLYHVIGKYFLYVLTGYTLLTTQTNNILWNINFFNAWCCF